MRGTPDRQDAIYHTFNVEELIEAEHPLRAIKRMVDRALAGMSRAFKAAYCGVGRPGIPPETLLKALLLQCLYTIRSERELCRRLKTDLLFRWFLDLQPSDGVFDHSVFTHNRARLAEHGITQKFFDSVVKQAIEAGLTSDEHFTVDGSLIQSHASLKSLKKIERQAAKDDDGPSSSGGVGGRNPSVAFKGERRGNATHRSTTDPEAKLYRKGDGVGAFLCHSGHALTENRHGLVMSVRIDEANGTAERENTLTMLDHLERRHGAATRPIGPSTSAEGKVHLELLRTAPVMRQCASELWRTGSSPDLIARMCRDSPFTSAESPCSPRACMAQCVRRSGISATGARSQMTAGADRERRAKCPSIRT